MREEIVYEAIDCLRKEGLRFSIDHLASNLHMSKKTIYKYFSNKEALAQALYKTYFQDIDKEIDKIEFQNNKDTYLKLLCIYFDVKMMTRSDVFNKYQLNENFRIYLSLEVDRVWKCLCIYLNSDEIDKTIIDGTCEKIIALEVDANEILERLVERLWF